VRPAVVVYVQIVIAPLSRPFSSGNESVNYISAKALSNGGGLDDPNQGDFAYAYRDQSTSYGLVGRMAKDQIFVLQPLQ